MQSVQVQTEENTMQTVCDHKFFGVFPEHSTKCPHAESRIRIMPSHERLLGFQLFVGGLVVSGLMLLAIRAFGLY